MSRPLSFTIFVDAREKTPLPFLPRYTILDRSRLPIADATRICNITVVKQTLKTGDYVLAGQEGVCYALGDQKRAGVVERKNGVDEIAKNCLDTEGRRRFIDCLKRMRDAFDRPLILFEGGFPELLAPTTTTKIPGPAADALLDLSHEYGVPVLPMGHSRSAGQRRLVAEYVIRFLISTELAHAHVPTSCDPAAS